MSAPTCRRCDDPAVAVFRFSRGCYCDPAEVQALCPHHAFKSGPARGGTMELIEDLTIDSSFTELYMSYYAIDDRANQLMSERVAPLIGDGPNARHEAAPRSTGDRTPQVAAELNRLHGLGAVAADNRKLIEELKERLAPVLRPHPMADPRAADSNGTCQLKQAEPLAPVAGTLRDLRERIGGQLHEGNAVLRWLLDALGI